MGEKVIIQSPASSKEKENFCTRRTRTEIVLAVALIATVSYFIYYKISISKVQTASNSSCVDAVCFESSLEIDDFVDPSVDPCEDFYQFVCGNFIKSAFAKHMTSPIFPEEERIMFELTGTIMEPISREDSQQVILQKKFFRSCLDLNNVNEDDFFFNLTQKFEEIGGWPILKGRNWIEEEFDWMAVTIKSKQLGLPFDWFLSFKLHLEDGENLLEIKPPLVSLKDPHYRNYTEDMLIAQTGFRSAIRSDIKNLLQFERNLKDVISKNEVQVSIYTIQELEDLYPKYNWIEFLNNMTDENYEFTNDTKIATNIESYIIDLDHLLMQTSKKVQANYIMWKMFEYFIPYMSFQVRSEYIGLPKTDDLLKFCLESTRHLFSQVAETEYVRKHSNSKRRKEAKKLAKTVKEEFTKRIEGTSWMTNKTIKEYLGQFKAITIDAGGQDEIFDEAFFDENVLHIGNLNFDSDNMTIIEMMCERMRSYGESLFGAIGKPGLDRAAIDAQLAKLETDVYFDKTSNRLMVPASALHGFLFDKDRPKSLNYGSLGSLIGAKLVENLIDRLKEDDGVKAIWTNLNYKIYEDGNKCLEDDISNHFQEELSLNASEVVQSVISDVLGRDIAYTAYQKWKKNNKEDIDLPLPYTPNQLFWIKSSLINCHKQLIDEDEEESEYVIPKFKNVLSLRHSAHFAEDFNCALDTPMNPKSKCWSFL